MAGPADVAAAERIATVGMISAARHGWLPVPYICWLLVVAHDARWLARWIEVEATVKGGDRDKFFSLFGTNESTCYPRGDCEYHSLI